MDSKEDDYDRIASTHITIDKDEEEQPPAIGEKNEESIKTQPCIECTDLDAKTPSLPCDSQQIEDALGGCKVKDSSLKSKGTQLSSTLLWIRLG